MMMYVIENKENTDLSTLQDQLEKQYGPAVAQDIIDHLRPDGPVNRPPDYMDVKAMSEMQERFRAQAIWKLKEWRKTNKCQPAQRNLIQLEGVFLQRQCEDAVSLYRLAHKTYFAMYREAIAAFATPVKYAGYGTGLAA